MATQRWLILAIGILSFGACLHAQEPVAGASDPDALFVVTVAYVRELKDPKDATKTYTTTWFDMWRFKDGKADEHWDPATK